MSTPIFTVDAFTSVPFRGNPAAVVILAPGHGRNAAWMQDVAVEMNLSETAFVELRPDGRPACGLRWFTPTTEVDLCGHATLAAAHVLWTEGRIDAALPIEFATRSGVLTTTREPGGRIAMDFPPEPPLPVAEPPAGLIDAMRVAPVWVGRNRWDYMLELASEDDVRAATPDLRALRAVATRGVIITALATRAAGADFVSRFFAPAAGIDEDPVTGSSHCCLGPYWGQKLGKLALTGAQLSARGGTVGVRLERGRVVLLGDAITVMRGELL